MSEGKYPYTGINGDYYDKDFLDSVWKELKLKVPIWESKIEQPTNVEKFAYHVMKQITR